jgi:hypothetical protein
LRRDFTAPTTIFDPLEVVAFWSLRERPEIVNGGIAR